MRMSWSFERQFLGILGSLAGGVRIGQAVFSLRFDSEASCFSSPLAPAWWSWIIAVPAQWLERCRNRSGGDKSFLGLSSILRARLITKLPVMKHNRCGYGTLPLLRKPESAKILSVPYKWAHRLESAEI